MEAIKILNDQERVSIWGQGIFQFLPLGLSKGIRKLAEEKLQINLAISLHAPDDNLRSKIVPANKKYPIEKILEAADKYLKLTGRKVMFEYIMIKDLNDSEKMAKELASLLKKMKSRLWFVNLIPCNDNARFKTSSPEQIIKFRKTLENLGVASTQRYRFGDDIKAACGQLTLKTPLKHS